MEIVDCSIVDFYEKCLPAADREGYGWVLSLVARQGDAPHIYSDLRNLWKSFDSITGEYFLFIFAGRESTIPRYSRASKIFDVDIVWSGIRNTFVEIINKESSLQTRLFDRRSHKYPMKIQGIPDTHTTAINSLKEYFSLSEDDIPCLVFSSLKTNKRYVVRISEETDIYGSFRNLFRSIDPILFEISKLTKVVKEQSNLVKQKRREVQNTKRTDQDRIIDLHRELVELCSGGEYPNLIECVEQRKYSVYPKDIRRKLNRYIDLSKKVEVASGTPFDFEEMYNEWSINMRSSSFMKHELETLERKHHENGVKLHELYVKIDGIIGGMNMVEKKNKDNGININITGNNNPVIVGDGNTYTVYETQAKIEELSKLLSDVRMSIPDDMECNLKELINEQLNNIEKDAKEKKPYKGFMDRAVNTIKCLSTAAQFVIAVEKLAGYLKTIFV